jgi:hypothetical protein
MRIKPEHWRKQTKKNLQKYEFLQVFFAFLAERTRLELATPGVTGRYSNQLNYRSAAEDTNYSTTHKQVQEKANRLNKIILP